MFGEVDMVAHMKGFLGLLDREKEKNTVGSLDLTITRAYSDPDALLWRILSHPYCKLLALKIHERDPDTLASSNVLKVVRRWHKEFPTIAPRSLFIVFNRDDTEAGSQEPLGDLRQILQLPGNYVKELILISASQKLRICQSVLRPVLEHPHNEVAWLTLNSMGSFTTDEANSLSKGLASTTCKVQAFFTRDCRIMPADANILLRSLAALPLENLNWDNSLEGNSEDGPMAVVTELCNMLERPGNTLQFLALQMSKWRQNHVAFFAKALTNRNCRVEHLDCDFSDAGAQNIFQVLMGTFVAFPSVSPHVPQPLFDVIRRPGNRLMTLKLTISPGEGTVALAENLASPNCRLESLTIMGCHPKAAITIAEVLETTRTSLRKLELNDQPRAVIRAFTESLRSSKNQLKVLTLPDDEDLSEERRNDFYRAARVSNLIELNDRPSLPFSLGRRKSGDQFFQVLHMLLSIKHIPRLGESAIVRILPLDKLILRIAKTIGWSIEDLRFPAPRVRDYYDELEDDDDIFGGSDDEGAY